VGSEAVVLLPPSLDFVLGVSQRQEPVGVQAPVPEAAIKRLDEGVVRRFAGPGEVRCHLAIIRPPVQRLGDELPAIVHFDKLRHPAVLLLQPLHHGHHLLPLDALIDLNGQALPAVVIHYSQAAELTPAKELVSHKAHAPAGMQVSGRKLLRPVGSSPAAPWPQASQVQSHQPIEPVDAFVVVSQQCHGQHLEMAWPQSSYL